MGLVVELPPLSPISPANPPGSGDQALATGDLFAALLASLASTAGEAPEAAAVPLPAPADDHQPETATDVTFALAWVPAPPLPATDAPAAAEEPAPAAEGLPVEAAPPPGPVALEVAAPPAATEPTAGTTVSDATGASAPADFTPGDGAPSNPADGGSVAPDALPPTEESAPQPAADGVVRPVGNAESFASAGPQPSPADRNARPLPRAAEPAILHAAPNSAVGQLRDAAPAPDAAPPRPADPPAPQAIQNLDAVATAVIERVEAGGGEARIHLEPAGLGEITIRLHTHHDAVHVDVHAETPEAVRLLRDAAADLSSLLGQRGMNLAGLDIGLGARQGGDSGSSSAGTRARPTAAPGEFAALLGIEDPAAVAREHRLRAAYNPDGSLLYRV